MPRSRKERKCPAATPRGWRIPVIVELSVGHLKHQRVVDVLFHPQYLTVGVTLNSRLGGIVR